LAGSGYRSGSRVSGPEVLCFVATAIGT
jgi:hypothetical protein